MFFLDRVEVDRELRHLRKELAASGGVREDLRGWSWDRPGPVEPPPYSGDLKFGVGELAGRYCDTLRDIYLRRVMGLRPPPSIRAARGIALHDVMRRVLLDVKRMIYDGFPISGPDILEELLPRGWEAGVDAIGAAESSLGLSLGEEERMCLADEARILYRFLLVQAAGRVDWAMSKFTHAGADSIVNQAVPPVAERKVDGAPIGLSGELSVDLYAGSMILDVKTGDVREFHPTTAAGYALAVEASEGIPIDFGAIVYVRVDVNRRVPSVRNRFFVIGDELREEFLEWRDRAFEIVETGRDPGKPVSCPLYCPWYSVCNPGMGVGKGEVADKRAGVVHGD